MHGNLIDCERRVGVVPQIVQVPLVSPDLASRPVEVREGWRKNRLQQLPRTLPERLDELEIQLRQGPLPRAWAMLALVRWIVAQWME